MSNMQTFRKWLSSTAEKPDEYRHSLERLTHLNRPQVMSAAGEIGRNSACERNHRRGTWRRPSEG